MAAALCAPWCSCRWELVEQLRRLILVGLMVLAQGSILQLVLGALLAAVFLLFQIQANPYQAMDDNFLASSASFALVAFFLCCSAFKSAMLTSLEDIQSKMSIEQRSIYVIDVADLTFIMTLSTFGTLVLSFVIFVIQFAIERERAARMQRASKARRLRFKKNQQEVTAPPVQQHCFHLFLSHV